MAVEKWNLDPVHSSVGFVVRHLMVSKVHGQFNKFSGSFAFDPESPSSSFVEAKIDAATIDTREPQRDAHLRSADFFETEKHPTLEFRSTRVERVDAEHFKLTGDLSMHGVTKPVTLDVELAGRVKHPQMGDRIGFSARGSIHRKDWGLTFNQVLDTGGLMLSDKVEIEIEAQGVRAT